MSFSAWAAKAEFRIENLEFGNRNTTNHELSTTNKNKILRFHSGRAYTKRYTRFQRKKLLNYGVKTADSVANNSFLKELENFL